MMGGARGCGYVRAKDYMVLLNVGVLYRLDILTSVQIVLCTPQPNNVYSRVPEALSSVANC